MNPPTLEPGVASGKILLDRRRGRDGFPAPPPWAWGRESRVPQPATAVSFRRPSNKSRPVVVPPRGPRRQPRPAWWPSSAAFSSRSRPRPAVTNPQPTGRRAQGAESTSPAPAAARSGPEAALPHRRRTVTPRRGPGRLSGPTCALSVRRRPPNPPPPAPPRATRTPTPSN